MSVRVVVTVCIVAAAAAGYAEAPSETAKPVEAELLARLNVRTLNPGDTVYARVARDWNGLGCHLRRGATLEATVRLATPHSHASGSEIAISFERADCGDAGLQPFRMDLEALAAPSEVQEFSADLPNPTTIGVQKETLHGTVQDFDSLPSLKSGEVHGLNGIRLGVATGPDLSSVLLDQRGDVLLEADTRLFLRPAKPVSTREAADPVASVAIEDPQKPAVTFLPADDDAIESGEPDSCAHPDCEASSRAGRSAQGAEERTYSGSIPLREFGYGSRSTREIFAPSDDEAVAWLSPTELLVTFNPHLLVPRQISSSRGPNRRIIRAVLIDISSHSIRQTLDWGLSDKGQFLWSLPGNRVLVHVGNELRVYGAGMQIQGRIGLSGPLAFARVSPDGEIIAIGVVRERHTPSLHASLAASLDRDPDEDVEVVLMNPRFETISSALSSSDASAPILLNEGQVKLVAAPKKDGVPYQGYSLLLHTWDDNSRSLSRFQSSCTPEISSLPPDLVFLVTCGKRNGAPEYRVLRPDGKTLMRGSSHLSELGHAASGGGSAASFALRIFKADAPLSRGAAFHAADLLSAELTIYRSEDGKRLSSVTVKEPAASYAGYAVSPDGNVAILTRDKVDVFSGAGKEQTTAVSLTQDPGSARDPQAGSRSPAGP